MRQSIDEAVRGQPGELFGYQLRRNLRQFGRFRLADLEHGHGLECDGYALPHDCRGITVVGFTVGKGFAGFLIVRSLF